MTREMKTDVEEIRIWEALELLTKAEHAISTVAAKTEDKYVYLVFGNAADDIKKVGERITPLWGFNKSLYTPYSILLL